MGTQDERVILKLMREAYDSVLEGYIKEINDKPYKGQEEEGSLLAPMLKIKHKKSGILYTIDAVGINSVSLVTPEGDHFTVSKDVIEKEYELD